MIGQGNAGEPGSIASAVVNNSGTLVFNRVEDLAYAGAVSGSGALTKQAAGMLTLAGTNSYTGNTTVTAGTLLISGAIGASSVSVTGGTLGGNGLVNGPVTVQSGGRLAPGASIGVLTISNSLTLLGVTLMELDAAANTNDLVRGLSSVNYGGTLTLSNLAGTVTASNTFKLFSANSYVGAFAVLIPAAPGSDLAWNTNTLATDGTLRLVSTVRPGISNALSGNALTLSWPADHIGWHLQAQTNSLTGNWVDVPTSPWTNQMNFTIDPNLGSVFYRLRSP
jgi:autotransporter-associated beta strand protein